jgi:RNA polymerase sigma factor (sigma-70 family)
MEIEEKLALYIKDINDKPLLSFDQETALSKTIQARMAVHSKIEDEDKRKESEKADSVLGKAIDDLTTHNLRLVIKEAFKFSRATGVSPKDLIGSGNLGLIKAAYLYDAAEHGTRFSTYATYWIRQAMFEAIHTSGVVKIPIHILNGRHRHNKLLEEGVIDDQDVMDEMDINEKQLQRIRDANVSVVSLDQEVSWGSDDDHASTIGDFIADEKAIDPSQGAVSQDQYRYLYEALDELDEMSKDIVTAQLMSDDKVQLRELGKKYGKTGERIRQIREKALQSLRKKIEYKMKHGSIKER